MTGGTVQEEIRSLRWGPWSVSVGWVGFMVCMGSKQGKHSNQKRIHWCNGDLHRRGVCESLRLHIAIRPLLKSTVFRGWSNGWNNILYMCTVYIYIYIYTIHISCIHKIHSDSPTKMKAYPSFTYHRCQEKHGWRSDVWPLMYHWPWFFPRIPALLNS